MRGEARSERSRSIEEGTEEDHLLLQESPRTPTKSIQLVAACLQEVRNEMKKEEGQGVLSARNLKDELVCNFI